MPFEGGPLELLHAIVQKRPMPVHEVRRDTPQVLAQIIDKVSRPIAFRISFPAAIADVIYDRHSFSPSPQMLGTTARMALRPTCCSVKDYFCTQLPWLRNRARPK